MKKTLRQDSKGKEFQFFSRCFREKKQDIGTFLSKFLDPHSTSDGGGNAPICYLPTVKQTHKEEEESGGRKFKVAVIRFRNDKCGRLNVNFLLFSWLGIL